MVKPTDGRNGHLPQHRVRFENHNEYCCCRLIPIQLAVLYVFIIGVLESIAGIALGFLTSNWTVLAVYGAIGLVHVVLLIGHIGKIPGLYTLYVIVNWTLAWISALFFGVAWFLYWIDKNRWVNPDEHWVWKWAGLPLEIDDRNLILGLSIAFMFNLIVQHCSVLIVLRRAYENMVQELEKE
ncbi:hypothetical protein M3Y99_00288800 [Aphelenchoides fujianensis]|nr:hypothetical protein M3Y99_00288800 [Aphelenchoides fujianensis]